MIYWYVVQNDSKYIPDYILTALLVKDINDDNNYFIDCVLEYKFAR